MTANDVETRLRDIFQFGSLRKRIYASPDLEAETRAVMESLGFARHGAEVVVPEHWTYGKTDMLVGWDLESERPDL